MKRILVSALILLPHLLLAQAPAAEPEGDRSAIEALEAELAEADGRQRLDLLVELSAAYRDLDAARAVDYGQEAIAMLDAASEEEQDAAKPTLIAALEHVGLAQQELADSQAALASFRRSLALAREIDEKPSIADNLLHIGRIHSREGRLPAAAVTLGRALTAATEVVDLSRPDSQQDRERLAQVQHALAETYAAQGNYRQAYGALQSYDNLRSQGTGGDAGRIAELETELAQERRERERQAALLQQATADRQQAPTSGGLQQNALAGAAIAGGVALLLLLASLLSRRRLKSRLLQQVAAKNAELEQTSAELERTATELEVKSAAFDRTSAELERTSAKLEQTWDELEQTSAELDLRTSALERTAARLEQTTSDLDGASTELDKVQNALGDQSDLLARAELKLQRKTEELKVTSGVLDRTSAELDGKADELERTSLALEQKSTELEETKSALELTNNQLDQIALALDRTNNELRQLRQRYQRETTELETRNSVTQDGLIELERFTSTLSQHLKVMLIAIRGALGSLEQDAQAGDVEQLRRDVKRTHTAIGEFVRLLDKLLKLLLVGRMTNATEEISMSELAFEAVGRVAGLVTRRQVEIVIAPDMPVAIGDRAQLLEVLQNLLENGGKFMGQQSAPRLEVSSRREGVGEDAETVFFVRDNGIGIDPHDQDKVFDLFEQLRPGKEGDGIGLALVKRIIDAHGGRVWVESEGAGKGSSFCFTLPEIAPGFDAGDISAWDQALGDV